MINFISCPVCNGTGIIIKDNIIDNCKKCNGTKLISELTGLPPISHNLLTNFNLINTIN